MLVYHFLNEYFALKDLREKRLKISILTELNDPFEFLGVDLGDRTFRDELNRAKEELSKKHGLLCFSKTWTSPAMWGLYADKHKGICLGLDIPQENLGMVKYVGTRMPKPKELNESFVKKLLFTKFKHWRHEQEYRVYTTLTDPEGEFYYANFSDIMKLKQVIVGDKSSVTRTQLTEALGNLQDDVEIFKARPDFRRFELVRNTSEKLSA